MPDAVAMGLAVAVGVGTLLLVGVVRNLTFSVPILGLGCKLLLEGLTWLVRVVLEVAREELVTMSFLRTPSLRWQ